MRYDLTRQQVAAVAAALRDELADDERAYLDTLEGETDLHEICARILNAIEADEGAMLALKEQIGDRKERLDRAAHRIDASREALKALLECAQIDKLTLPEATVSVRKVAPKPIVTDDAAIPDELCRFTRKPDMAAIKAGLEAGRAVSGVSFDNGGNSLTIRRK